MCRGDIRFYEIQITEFTDGADEFSVKWDEWFNLAVVSSLHSHQRTVGREFVFLACSVSYLFQRLQHSDTCFFLVDGITSLSGAAFQGKVASTCDLNIQLACLSDYQRIRGVTEKEQNQEGGPEIIDPDFPY